MSSRDPKALWCCGFVSHVRTYKDLVCVVCSTSYIWCFVVRVSAELSNMAARLFGGSTDEAVENYEAVRSDGDPTTWYINRITCMK